MEDIKVLGEKGTKDLVKMRWNGLKLTQKRLGEDRIDLLKQNGYELIFDEESYKEEIEKINQLLFPLFSDDVFTFEKSLVSDFGFDGVKGIIKNKFEAQLDTGKLIKNLWDLALTKGVNILTGADVEHVESDHAILSSGEKFSGKAIVLCTNGFTNRLNEVNLLPGRGIVLHIKTENPIRFKGTFHYDQGYYYFRDYHQEILFGGGRNLDPETETTTEFDINEFILQKLIKDLDEIIIPGQKFEIINKWAGIMAFGKDKAPIIKKTADNIFMGVKLGGMGVAIGSQVGETLSSLIIANRF
jgi:glycine/D-amino acid oxidase-like deaminating enzyme